MSTWKLPNEISLEAFSYLPNETLLNLYCASHQLRAITASIIYRDVDLDSSKRQKSNQIDLFLRTILQNPELGTYVTKAKIKWSGDRDSDLNRRESSKESDGFEQVISNEQTEKTKDRATKLGITLTSQLSSAIIHRSESAQVMILLMLLGNLEELKISAPLSAEHFRLEIIELARSGKYLTKLRLYDHSEEVHTIPSWIPVSYISSFRHVYVMRASRLGLSNPIPHNSDILFNSQIEFTDRQLNLLDLSLSISHFDSEWLKNMLTVSTTVQNLDVTYRGLCDDGCISIPRICEVHSSTLQRLTIRISAYRRFYYPDSISDQRILGFLTQSWERFTALRYLRGPVDLLFGGFFPDPSAAMSTVTQSRPLIYFPRSLEGIHFNRGVFQRPHPYGGGTSYWDYDQISKLLCMAFSGCDSEYPRLTKIYLECFFCQSFNKFQRFLNEQGKPSEMAVYCGLRRANCGCHTCVQPNPMIH